MDLMAASESLKTAMTAIYNRPPKGSRNVWRVVDALGVSREVASEDNARSKAEGFDRVCPARECPHRVQRWNGEEWVDA